MERKDLVRMAVDLHNKTPQGNYSLDEMNDILKKAVFGKDYENYIENGQFDIYRATRDGKIDYTLIEQIITEGTKRELDAASPLLGFIDWQNYAEGDTGEFEIRDSDEKFYISRIAEGTQGLRRQRLFGGRKVTIKPVLHGVKIYEELRRIASGRADFGHMIDVAIKSFAQARTLDAFNATKAVFDNIADTKYFKSGSFDEEAMTQLIDFIEAKTGLKASIIGSKQAVRKITSVRGNDSNTAKEQMFAMGYYGQFYTTPIYVLNNVLDDNDQFMLPNDLYVIAGDEKFLKGVEEGTTLIIPGNPLTNADLSQEWLMAQRYAIEAIVASKNGVYRLA